jgi:hypothetical protein
MLLYLLVPSLLFTTNISAFLQYRSKLSCVQFSFLHWPQANNFPWTCMISCIQSSSHQHICPYFPLSPLYCSCDLDRMHAPLMLAWVLRRSLLSPSSNGSSPFVGGRPKAGTDGGKSREFPLGLTSRTHAEDRASIFIRGMQQPCGRQTWATDMCCMQCMSWDHINIENHQRCLRKFF